MSKSDIDFIEQLERVIAERLERPSKDSYTSSLAEAGVARIAQKVGEEAVEVALASVAGDRDEVIREAADLVYHLLLLLNAQQIKLADIADKLRARHETTATN